VLPHADSVGPVRAQLVLIVWAAPGTTLTERDLEQLTVYGSLARTSLARARTVAKLPPATPRP